MSLILNEVDPSIIFVENVWISSMYIKSMLLYTGYIKNNKPISGVIFSIDIHPYSYKDLNNEDQYSYQIDFNDIHVIGDFKKYVYSQTESPISDFALKNARWHLHNNVLCRISDNKLFDKFNDDSDDEIDNQSDNQSDNQDELIDVYGIRYHNNGNIHKIGTFINDEFIEGDLYHENGNFYYRGMFENNKPHGNCLEYNEDGDLIYEGKYVDGSLVNGEEYDTNGDVWYEGSFQNGLYHGKGKLYRNDGDTYLEGTFVDGIISGISTSYYTFDNIPYQTGLFHNNQFIEGKVFDSMGDLIFEGKLYENDNYQEMDYYKEKYGYHEKKGYREGKVYAYYYNSNNKKKINEYTDRTVVYDGTFYEDGKYKYGKLYDPKNKVLLFEGTFEDNFYKEGKKFLKSIKMEGKYKNNNLIEGTKYIDADFHRHVGKFDSNENITEGYICYGNYKYEGQFKNNNLNGYGRIWKNNKLLYEGHFDANQSDKLNGPGKIYKEDGSLLSEGNYRNHLLYGNGKKYANNIYQEGTFINDELHGDSCIEESKELTKKGKFIKNILVEGTIVNKLTDTTLEGAITHNGDDYYLNGPGKIYIKLTIVNNEQLNNVCIDGLFVNNILVDLTSLTCLEFTIKKQSINFSMAINPDNKIVKKDMYVKFINNIAFDIATVKYYNNKLFIV